MLGRGGRGSASKSISAHKQPAKAARKSPRSGRLRVGADTAQIISRLRRSGEYRSPPKRTGHEVAASWGFSGGWVGGQSEYKKACEADTTPNERLGTHPTARKQSASAARKSPRSGRLRVGADTAQIISRLRRSGEYRSPPKRSGHEVAASWGFSGGWVGGRSEYIKACEADTTP